MNEEQTSYKVTDRRLFNPDGTPRDVPESERPEVETPKAETVKTAAAAEPVAAAAPVAPEPPPPPTQAVPKPAPAQAETKPESSEADLPAGVDDPAGFATVVFSFVSKCGSALGMA